MVDTIQEVRMSDRESTVDVVPVAGKIGAEIRGVRLLADLSAGVRGQIRDAWLKHKVVFFRNQQHLDEAAQESLPTLFGAPPIGHPTVPAIDGTRYITELDSRHGGRATSWHSDVIFVDAYPRASILRALVVPTAGGDTVWANTEGSFSSN
jgi:taurine dioxygenase